MGQTIRIHDIIDKSQALGPGNRLIISVQGCSIKCPHCIVPETHSKNGGTEWTTDELLNRIFHAENINGITIIGGEPMEQANALTELCKAIKKHSNLSIFTYTGYTIKELIKDKNVWQLQLLALSDMVCDGPYCYELTDTKLLWRGSKNQKLYVFSERCRSEIKKMNAHIHVELENVAGKLRIMGVADEKFIECMLKA